MTQITANQEGPGKSGKGLRFHFHRSRHRDDARGASMAAGYTNSWGYLLVLLLLGHFIIPFLGIMPRHVKSSQRAMIF